MEEGRIGMRSREGSQSHSRWSRNGKMHREVAARGIGNHVIRMALASLRDTCTDILAEIQGQVVLVLVSMLEKGWGWWLCGEHPRTDTLNLGRRAGW